MPTDFASTRAQFDLPQGLVYLDGNSLGPMPRQAVARVTAMLREEWGRQLVGSWNHAGWMAQPERLGARIARLIGAAPGCVSVGDTLSIRLFQALAAALEERPERRVILTDSGNFPSDLYIARGLAEWLGRGHELRVTAPEGVADALTDEVAVLMLTEVDYRTARRHDMAALSAQARAAGAATVWDLAHSAGAVPLDLAGCGVDFAVGCSYKFLNGGPGAPAFLYAAPHVAERAAVALPGWLGHAEPFAFEPEYRPAPGVQRMRIGTPPVIQMAALEAALDIWDAVAPEEVYARSVELSEALRNGVARRCPELALASPADPPARGSQLSFRHPEAFAICKALIAEQVVGDFRAPDILRFGITPLYLGETEIAVATERLAEIMATRRWDRPEFRRRAGVT